MKKAKRKICIIVIALVIIGMFGIVNEVRANETESSELETYHKIMDNKAKEEEAKKEEAKAKDSLGLSGLEEMYSTNGTKLQSKVGNLLWIAQVICYAAAVIVLMLKGYKFMKASPEAKAEIKKELISYGIGAILLFATGTIISIVANITNGIFGS